jgi:hypothetical protein
MLYRNFLVLLLLLLFSWPALADPNGTVSISLQEFLKLQAANNTAVNNGPPKNVLLSGATYQVKVDDKWANIEAQVTLDVKSKSWQEVPLLGTTAVLTETTLDGKPFPVYQKDGKFQLLTRVPGRHSLKMTYKLPLTKSGRVKSFGFMPLHSPVCRVKFYLPQSGLKLSSSPATPIRTASKVATMTLPGGNQVTQLSWEPKAQQTTSAHKARLRAEVHTVAQVSETAVRCTSQVRYEITGETDLLRLSVPADVEVLDVEAQSISGWNVIETKSEKQIHVALSRPATGSATVKVVYEKPIDNINTTWELPWISAGKVRSVKGFVAVVCGGSIEVTPADTEEARTIEPDALPAELRQGKTKAALKYSAEPYHITLDTHKGEEVNVLTASIDSADAKTLVTPDGKVVSTFTYNLRNNRKQYLELKLPPGMTVWSAFVNGEATKPVETDDGIVKLALISSQNGQAFPVELTCVSPAEDHYLMGSQDFQAPSVDVPISNLKWTFFWPEQREVMQFDTDMQKLSSTTPTNASQKKSKPKRSFTFFDGDEREAEKAEDEGASVEEIPSDEPQSSRGMGATAVGEEQSRESFQDTRNHALSNIVKTTSLGSFPVRVRVPEAGQAYSFQKLMVTKEMPTVTVRYYNSSLSGGLAKGTLLVLLALILGLGYKRLGSRKVEQESCE